MGTIEDLRLFATIVDRGSISGAADALRIAKSAVSRRLKLLEERYGSRLISRDRGNWSVTATGRELYQRAVEVVSDVDEIEEDFREASRALAGPLRVSVPRDFGLNFLSPALMAFKAHYPEVQLMVDFDDRKVDLSRESYDFAIRIASDLDPGFVARQIGQTQQLVFASPDYLASKGTPVSFADLEGHDLLHYGAERRSSWNIGDRRGKKYVFEFQPVLNSNAGIFLLDAAIEGLGIARMPDFICQSAIDDGRVVPILTDMMWPSFGIYIVHDEERRLNRRMRLFADEMELACREGAHRQG